MKYTPYIIGKLINLRSFHIEDKINYRSWLDNATVTKYMEMGYRPSNEYNIEEVYKEANFSENNIVMIIEDKNNKPIGVVGLYCINWIIKKSEFRILIGETDYYGKGYGTEATKLILNYGFNRLNLETIYLGVNEENISAYKTYLKAGFVKEGVRRNFVYNNGKYYNSVMMSILKDEYNSK